MKELVFLLSVVWNICKLQDGRNRSVSGINHSPTAWLCVPSALWAPNRPGPIKDGEAAHSSLRNTAQGNQ